MNLLKIGLTRIQSVTLDLDVKFMSCYQLVRNAGFPIDTGRRGKLDTILQQKHQRGRGQGISSQSGRNQEKIITNMNTLVVVQMVLIKLLQVTVYASDHAMNVQMLKVCAKKSFITFHSYPTISYLKLNNISFQKVQLLSL